MVVVDSPGTDDGTAALGADLVGRHRPAEVVLSHLLPYQTPVGLRSAVASPASCSR